MPKTPMTFTSTKSFSVIVADPHGGRGAGGIPFTFTATPEVGRRGTALFHTWRPGFQVLPSGLLAPQRCRVNVSPCVEGPGRTLRQGPCPPGRRRQQTAPASADRCFLITLSLSSHSPSHIMFLLSSPPPPPLPTTPRFPLPLSFLSPSVPFSTLPSPGCPLTPLPHPLLEGEGAPGFHPHPKCPWAWADLECTHVYFTSVSFVPLGGSSKPVKDGEKNKNRAQALQRAKSESVSLRGPGLGRQQGCWSQRARIGSPPLSSLGIGFFIRKTGLIPPTSRAVVRRR